MASTPQPIFQGPRTTSGVLAGGGVERKDSWQQALRHHIRLIIGYNWLIAVTIAPFAFAAAFLLAVVLPESVRNPWRPPPVAVLCIAGYIFFEVTSFCLERTWSRVSIWRFWRLAVPLAVLQAFLCLRLARHDALGCLLFTSLCLGCREFLFQFQALFQADGRCYTKSGCTQEKLTAAFLGGSAYGMAVALLCALSGALVHAVVGDGRKVLSPVYIDVLIALALPLGRNLSRMALNQSLANATSAGALLAGSEQPKLDALVMYGDILFLLTMFMEVPFAFVFLLVPRTITFCLALALNVLVDVFFVQALDVVLRPSSMRLQNGETTRDLDERSPTYCIERPESIFATLSSGVMVLDPSESTLLCPSQEGELQEDNTRSCSSCSCCPDYLQLLMRTNPVCRQVRSCWLSACGRPQDDEDASNGANSKAVTAMSPRVSLLLDEHNAGVIGCWAGRTESSRGGGHAVVFFRQERKIALTTHFLCSTLALAIVTVALPVAKYAGDNHRTEFLGLRHISAPELAIRAVAVLVLRVLADIVALRLLEQSATGARGGDSPSLWQSRSELSTFHSWFFRALAATCPLFAVIAATL